MSRRRNLIKAGSLCALGLLLVSGCTAALADPGHSRGHGAGGGTGDRSEDGRPAHQRGGPLLSAEEAAAITVDADIVYRVVDGEQITLDICRADDAGDAEADDSGRTRAAVMLIHGGGFRAGDKDGRQWQEICRWIADAGYVAVNLNYRLAPEYPYPAAFEDVQEGVEWTRAHAGTYGIDPDRIGALGGSAGANLAQLLGSVGDGETTTGSRVGSVVSLSGPSDLTERALELGEPDDRQIQTVLDYLDCSQITDCPAAEAASPITHVDPSDPPFLILHSERERMPVEQAQALADALTDAGATPEVRIRPGYAHATGLLADRSVQSVVLDFLERTLS